MPWPPGTAPEIALPTAAFTNNQSEETDVVAMPPTHCCDQLQSHPSLWSLPRLLEKILDPCCHAAKDSAAHMTTDMICLVLEKLVPREEGQSYTGRVHRRIDEIGQAADLHGEPQSDRHLENGFGSLRHAGHDTGATGDHHPAGKASVQALLLDAVQGKGEDLLDTALDDLSEECAWSRLRLLRPETLHINHVMRLDKGQ